MRNKKKIEEKENQIAGIFFAERGGVGLELDQWEERQKEQVFRPFVGRMLARLTSFPRMVSSFYKMINDDSLILPCFV